jgi:DUF3040 family protein/parallel beta helix pectate lyase-like protein
VHHCTLGQSRGDNVWLEWCVASTVHNNVISNYLYSGVMVISGIRITVSGNTIADAPLSSGVVNTYGIAVTDLTSQDADRSRHVTVVGNTVLGCPRGIALVVGNETRTLAPNKCVVAGNTVNAAGMRQSQLPAVYLSGIANVPASATVVGNQVVGYTTPFFASYWDRGNTFIGQNSEPFVDWSPITIGADFTPNAHLPAAVPRGRRRRAPARPGRPCSPSSASSRARTRTPATARSRSTRPAPCNCCTARAPTATPTSCTAPTSRADPPVPPENLGTQGFSGPARGVTVRYRPSAEGGPVTTCGAAMLSHHEDRELRAIEEWFELSDPALSRMLRDHQPPKRRWWRLAGRLAADVLGAALFLLGAVLSIPVLVVPGVLLIVVGVCLHLAAGIHRRHARPPH